MNIEKALSVINNLVDAGIYASGSFIIGCFTDTYEEAQETVTFSACHFD